MLDEPTNHLDLESLVWFQEYLKSYSGAILMISHDREFLNQLVGSILEISHRRLNRYRGNWDSYVAQREAREEQQLAAYKNQQKEIASLQLFADRLLGISKAEDACICFIDHVAIHCITVADIRSRQHFELV